MECQNSVALDPIMYDAFGPAGIISRKEQSHDEDVKQPSVLTNGNGLTNGHGLTNGSGFTNGNGLTDGHGHINGDGLTNDLGVFAACPPSLAHKNELPMSQPSAPTTNGQFSADQNEGKQDIFLAENLPELSDEVCYGRANHVSCMSNS